MTEADLTRMALERGGKVTGHQPFAEDPFSGIYVIEIPNYLTPSLNILMHCHWTKKHKLKKECSSLVYACGAHVPIAHVKRRVRLTLTRCGRRKELDPDNAKKCVLDALVACGLLKDDKAAWCECPDPVQMKGSTNSTRIELEDLP